MPAPDSRWVRYAADSLPSYTSTSTIRRPAPEKVASRRRVVASTQPVPVWLAGHQPRTCSGSAISSSTTSHDRLVAASQSNNAIASATGSVPSAPGAATRRAASANTAGIACGPVALTHTTRSVPAVTA